MANVEGEEVERARRIDDMRLENRHMLGSEEATSTK